MQGVAGIDLGFFNERALGWCLLLNAIVLWAAWRFARRRMSDDPAMAAVDTGLLWYAVQYAAIGLPGMVGCLWPGMIYAVALLLAAIMLVAGGRRQRAVAVVDLNQPASKAQRWIAAAGGCFGFTFLLAYAYFNRFLPVTSNDALTYHFPAAASWLAAHRIVLLPTWFFNPANTYSPLAGSTFIAWWMAPLGNDVLARYVEVPALALAGVAIYQLARQLKADLATAVLVAAAGLVARPYLHAAMLSKDDLAETFFFCAAVVAMSPARAGERLGWLRLGIAVGLLLATKYTALLSVPILLLAIDGPIRAGWRWRWAAAAAVAIALAGPWYLRNWILAGNPLFPLVVHLGSVQLFPGLFSTARSDALRGLGAWEMLTLPIAMPAILLAALVAGWALLVVTHARQIGRDPLVRTIALGPVVGLICFLALAPFPEARFVYPSFALLLVAAAAAIAQVPSRAFACAAGVALLGLSTACSFHWGLSYLTVQFAEEAACITAAVLIVAWFVRRWRPMRRWVVLGIPLALISIGFTFVNWSAYVGSYRDLRFVGGVSWSLFYPMEEPTWEQVDQQLPPDAVVAYSNSYMIYPMMGFGLHRRLVYAPTRPGLHGIGDLPVLGQHLTGEQIVPAAAKALTKDADRTTWLLNLRNSRAQYLVIFAGGVLGEPPEAKFAANDHALFEPIFRSGGTILYRIHLPIMPATL